jgi:hypothetical protein
MRRKKGKMIWWIVGIVAVLVIFRKRIPMVDNMLSKLMGPSSTDQTV